jgi:hypothetical protein
MTRTLVLNIIIIALLVTLFASIYHLRPQRGCACGS